WPGARAAARPASFGFPPACVLITPGSRPWSAFSRCTSAPGPERDAMAVPVLRPTTAQGEQFAGLTYHIEGELVPALHIELGHDPVHYEHYILLWKDPAVQVG